jgi:hypothetical protein
MSRSPSRHQNFHHEYRDFELNERTDSGSQHQKPSENGSKDGSSNHARHESDASSDPVGQVETYNSHPQYVPPQSEPNYEDLVQKAFPMRVWESFQRDPTRRASTKGTLGADGKVIQNFGAAEGLLARKLKGRHLQMIAIGGSIGTICPTNSEPESYVLIRLQVLGSLLRRARLWQLVVLHLLSLPLLSSD